MARVIVVGWGGPGGVRRGVCSGRHPMQLTAIGDGVCAAFMVEHTEIGGAQQHGLYSVAGLPAVGGHIEVQAVSGRGHQRTPTDSFSAILNRRMKVHDDSAAVVVHPHVGGRDMVSDRDPVTHIDAMWRAKIKNAALSDGHVPLDEFWHKRGYVKQPHLRTTIF